MKYNLTCVVTLQYLAHPDCTGVLWAPMDAQIYLRPICKKAHTHINTHHKCLSFIHEESTTDIRHMQGQDYHFNCAIRTTGGMEVRAVNTGTLKTHIYKMITKPLASQAPYDYHLHQSSDITAKAGVVSRSLLTVTRWLSTTSQRFGKMGRMEGGYRRPSIMWMMPLDATILVLAKWTSLSPSWIWP